MLIEKQIPEYHPRAYWQIPDGLAVRSVIQLDANGNPLATTTNQSVSNNWQVKVAGTGYAVNDILQEIQTWDVSQSPPVYVSSVWLNITQGTTLSSPPNLNDLVLAGGGGLPVGASTAANQVIEIGYLADLADGNDKYASYKLSNVEDLNLGTKYLLKYDGTNWLMIKKVYTDTTSAFTYASQTNNAGVAFSAAWVARTTLTYGTIAQV